MLNSLKSTDERCLTYRNMLIEKFRHENWFIHIIIFIGRFNFEEQTVELLVIIAMFNDKTKPKSIPLCKNFGCVLARNRRTEFA